MIHFSRSTCLPGHAPECTLAPAGGPSLFPCLFPCPWIAPPVPHADSSPAGAPLCPVLRVTRTVHTCKHAQLIKLASLACSALCDVCGPLAIHGALAGSEAADPSSPVGPLSPVIQNGHRRAFTTVNANNQLHSTARGRVVQTKAHPAPGSLQPVASGEVCPAAVAVALFRETPLSSKKRLTCYPVGDLG